MTGYIKLHRGWMQCDAFDQAEPFSEREAWLWLIENAAWKECTRRDSKGAFITVQRGQMHTSLRNLGLAWQWGKNKVFRYLERLKKCNMIGTASGQSGLLITICNYCEYQGQRDSLGTESETQTGQPRDTQEEGKEVKEGKKDVANATSSAWVCPDGVDRQHWVDLLANRKAKKLKNTATAYAGLIRDLDQLCAKGWTRGQLVQYAAEKGWGAIYEPSERNGAASGRPSGYVDRGAVRTEGNLQRLRDAMDAAAHEPHAVGHGRIQQG